MQWAHVTTYVQVQQLRIVDNLLQRNHVGMMQPLQNVHLPPDMIQRIACTHHQHSMSTTATGSTTLEKKEQAASRT